MFSIFRHRYTVMAVMPCEWAMEKFGGTLITTHLSCCSVPPSETEVVESVSLVNDELVLSIPRILLFLCLER